MVPKICILFELLIYLIASFSLLIFSYPSLTVELDQISYHFPIICISISYNLLRVYLMH